MALQFIYEDEFGNTHPEAYGRISYFSVTRDINNMPILDYIIEIYSHYNARMKGKQPLSVIEDFVDYDDTQLIDLKLIYNYAKCRSIFSKSIDVDGEK